MRSKNRQQVLLASVVLASAVLAGCGGGSSGSKATAAEGTWDASCEIDEDGDPTMTSFVVTGGSFTVSETNYTRGTDCSEANAAFVRTRSGTFSESGPMPVPARGNRYDVDIVTTQYTVNPISEAYVNAVNGVMLCGRSDWVANTVAIENECDVFDSGVLPPYSRYDTYLVENGELFFGAGGASETEEGRPATVADSSIFSLRGGSTSMTGGDSDEGDSSNPLQAALQGSWLDSCDFDVDGGSITTFTFDGSSFSVAGQEHDDRACNEPSLDITLSGTFALANPTEVSRGTQSEIDLSFETLTMIIRDDAVATQFSAGDVCGNSDWTVGVSYDLTNCSTFLQTSGISLPYTQYDIVLVEGNEFFGGIGDPGDTADDRPTRISAVATAEKI